MADEKRKPEPPKIRRLLVLDGSYSLEAIRSRGLEESVTCRDLDGFFEHVWTVHPFATLVTSEGWTSRYGRPEVHHFAPRHTFVEGKVGRFALLHRLSALNFIIGQIGVFVRLARLIHQEKICVIRSGEALYMGLFGWALSRLCGIPLVVRIGANSDKIYETTGEAIQGRFFRSRKIETIVERFVLARAELVAAANLDNLAFAIANNARPECSTLFRYGNLIDKRHFAEPTGRADGRMLLREDGINSKRFLLYIGRLGRLKHTDDVVRVVAEVRRRGHDVQGLLVGDGPERIMLEKLALELGVQDQVKFCGNRDQQWLARVIPIAAVVVSPITGRALTEAALGAAPIVAYDVDWQSELIRTGETGELVPHREWRQMTDAVERLLNSPVYARAMGDALRKRALMMLDPASLNQHEREHYAALLHRAAHRPQTPP